MVREIGLGNSNKVENSNDFNIYYNKITCSLLFCFIDIFTTVSFVSSFFLLLDNKNDEALMSLGLCLFSLVISLIYLRIILRKEPAITISDKDIKIHSIWTNNFNVINFKDIESVGTKKVKNNKFVVLNMKKKKEELEIKNAFFSNSKEISTSLLKDYNHDKLSELISKKIGK